MRNAIDIGSEAKSALLLDAPDIAAQAITCARVSSRVAEALKDYATIQTLQSEAEYGSTAAAELQRIRSELITEIRRALARDSGGLGERQGKD